MFTSDRDLRKAVPKKVTGSRHVKQATGAIKQIHTLTPPTNNDESTMTRRDDIIEVAKRQREARANQRESTVVVLRIQSWWRGRSTSRNYYNMLSSSMEGKLSDIEKLSSLLGISFVAPPAICFELVHQILVLSLWSPFNAARILDKLCKHIIVPSASELDAAKNIMTFQFQKDPGMRTLSALFTFIVRVLMSGFDLKNKRNVSTAMGNQNHAALCESMLVLTGAHAPFKMKFSTGLDVAFKAMKTSLLENSKGCILHQLRTYFVSCGTHLLSRTNSNGEQVILNGTSVTAAVKPPAGSANDKVFDVCIFLLEGLDEEYRIRKFVFHMFSIPMFTLLLSNETLVTFCRGKLFSAMLSALAIPTEVSLPRKPTEGPSAAQVISPGQWVLGNLAALSDPLLLSCSNNNKAVSPAPLLCAYLRTCTAWLATYCQSEVLLGRSGIIWQRQGANSIALAVPCGLEEQVLTLVSPRVLSELNKRFILPIGCPADSSGDGSGGAEAQGAEWVSQYAQPEDVKDIAQALSSSAYAVTQATLKDHQEASTWFTAKWARKISSSISSSLGLSSLVGGASSASSSSSSSSSSSARGSKPKAEVGSNSKLSAIETGNTYDGGGCGGDVVEDSRLVAALCGLWEVLLSSAANAPPDSLPWKALSQLAFSGAVVPKLWCFLLRQQRDLDAFASAFKSNWSCHNSDQKGVKWRESMSVLLCLVSVLQMVLIVLGDSELYEEGKPLPLHQIVRLVRCLKVILFKTLQEDPNLLTERETSGKGGSSTSTTGSTSNINYASASGGDKSSSDSNGQVQIGVGAARAASQRRTLQNGMRAVSCVLSDLYSRWARRPFSSAALWEISEATGRGVLAELQQRTSFGTSLLRVMPWCVDFHERMKLFRRVLDEERLQVQGSNDLLSGGPQRSRGVVVKVRKARILEDGMDALARVGANIKDRIVVKYINDFGEEEAGIDAGGLFKDFVTDLSGRIFDPSYGLFCTTAANLLYPNPSAAVLFDPHEMDTMFVFLGRVLGKALYENITLQPQFAHFFLAFMHGKYNYMNLINDLHTLDPELYKNLMFLKTYEGDIADLGLTFSITDTSMGGQKEVDLIPGGGNMDVTSQNRHRYINLAAKYYLHDRLKRQAKAFFSGLYQVVHPDLLGMFCAPELQILISGSQSGLSVEDLMKHTRYAGGYVFLDRHVTRFWTVFAELSAEDQALLLKFVTSCERPPSLGFASLQPPFTIQRVDCADDQRLPTASTCFNILKLPTYSSARVLREKLLQSIRAKAGFDLS